MLSQLVWIREFPDSGEARLAQRLLDANGIHSVITDDGAGAEDAPLGLARGVRLAVREDDAPAARLLLEPGEDP
jgi:hypothetical protein